MNRQNDESDKAGSEIEVKEEEIPSCFLPPCIVKILDDEDATCSKISDDDNNIPTDHQYFNALLATETCRALIDSLVDQNRHKYFELETKSLSKRKTVAESLGDLFRMLSTKLEAIRKRMEEGDQAPLIEKFLNALEANDEEKKIFRFNLCLSMMSSEFFPVKDSRRIIYRDAYGTLPTSKLRASASEIQRIFDVPLPHIMQMMNADSVWVKEQVYFNNSKSHTAESTNSMMSPSFFGHAELVLQGYSVTLPQYEGLKSTLLQKTLLEHPPFLESDVGRRVLRRNAVGNKQPTASSRLDSANPLVNALKDANPLANALKNDGSSGAGGLNPNGGDRFSGTKRKRDRLFDALAISMKAEMNQELHNRKSGAKNPVNVNNAVGTDLGLGAGESVVTEVKSEKEDYSKMKSKDDEFSPYTSDLAYLEVRISIFVQGNG